jgi:predicted regulator of amino acid metabolism with ACT domain
MWRQFAKYFNRYPKRKKLAQKLLEYGLKIKENKIYCGEIELSDSKLARAFDLDRRIILDTIKTINENQELKKIFSELSPTCHLKDVATKMKWGVIEIIPTDPSMPGILADVSKIISDAKVSIRQAIVDDFELSEEPRLFIVTEKQVPLNLIIKIRQAKGVKAVQIF